MSEKPAKPSVAQTLFAYVAIATGLMVLFLVFDHRWLAIAAAVMGAIGLLWPWAAAWITRGWLKLAEGLGWMNGRVLIGVVFLLVLTPIAMLRRLGTKDPHHLRTRPPGSLWTVRDHTYTPSDLEKPS